MEIAAGNGSPKPEARVQYTIVDCNTESERRWKGMMGKEYKDKKGCENISCFV
jgi:hypothetical protein